MVQEDFKYSCYFHFHFSYRGSLTFVIRKQNPLPENIFQVGWSDLPQRRSRSLSKFLLFTAGMIRQLLCLLLLCSSAVLFTACMIRRVLCLLVT